jgi:transposase
MIYHVEGIGGVKDVHDWIGIKRLHKNGVKIKQIARQLKMSKNTVKKLLKQESEPEYQRRDYPTKIDKYKEQISTWYLSPEYDFNGTRIFKEIQKLGYQGSEGPIYRYLRTLKAEKREVSKKATVRFETPIGDQSQYDWAQYKMVIGNEIKEIYCFSMILAASRMKSIAFSLTVDGDAIYEAIQELFCDLGGVTKELLIDNPKALVLENEADSEPKFNFDALRLATHLGTELNPCNPYRARTKGKIEKPFQYIEEQFIKGNPFANMTELNAAGKSFMKEWCKQVHGTTKRIPEEFHKEELPHLMPLPKKKFFRQTLTKRRVSLDSLISIDAKKYSVPVKYVGKDVKYRIVYGYKIEIYDLNMNLIATHEIKTDNNDVTKLDEHYEAIAGKVPKSLPEIKRQFIATFKNGSEYLIVASKILGQAGYHARQILKLKDLYSVESIDTILAYCIQNGHYRIDEIKEVIRDKYIDLVLKGKLDAATCSEVINNGALIRDLSYYERGGQN